MKLGYNKNYFNLAKIFVLKLLKMVVNQREMSKLKQNPAVKFLLAEKYKPCEISRRMCDVLKESCISQRNVYKSSKPEFKESPW